MPPKQDLPPTKEELDVTIGIPAEVDIKVLQDPEESLKTYGFALIKVFEIDELKQIEQMIDEAITQFPEYNKPLEDDEGEPIPYALGGFAAFGNPGSFHHPVLNLIRLHIYKKIVAAFKEIRPEREEDEVISDDEEEEDDKDQALEDEEDKDEEIQFLIEMLLDRLTVREKGQVPPEEAWHRDVTPTKGTTLRLGDVIYGGFTNLNSDMDQHFSCVPGTDQGFSQFTLKSGFTDIAKKFHSFCRKHRYQVKIPPGYHIIFPQHIVHEIVAIPAKKRMYRIFLGIRTRIVEKDHPGVDPEGVGQHLFSKTHLKEFLDEQSVPKLPSGQVTPIFSANHQRCWKNKQFKVFPNGPKMSVLEWLEAAFTDEVKDRLRSGDWPVPRFLPPYKKMDLLKHFPLFGHIEEDCLTLQTIDKILAELDLIPELFKIDDDEEEEDEEEDEEDEEDEFLQYLQQAEPKTPKMRQPLEPKKAIAPLQLWSSKDRPKPLEQEVELTDAQIRALIDQLKEFGKDNLKMILNLDLKGNERRAELIREMRLILTDRLVPDWRNRARLITRAIREL